MTTMPWTQTALCWLLTVATLDFSASALPSPESKEHINRIMRSDDIDGYDIATVYAVDTGTNKDKRQSKRDIETLASDSTSVKRSLSLQLTSGQRLRMSLERRSIDTSGATFTEVTERGERKITVEDRDCFFSGALEGEEEGFASVAMCDGEMMGAITTSKRDYEIRPLPQTAQKRDADDVMNVMVTWREARQAEGDEGDDVWMIPATDDQTEIAEGDEEDDVLMIPGDHATDDQTEKRSVTDRRATIEIADYVDEFFIEDVKNKLNIVTNSQIIDLIVSKWSAVATNKLSNKDLVGWDITLRLVKVVIMRTNTSYYKAAPLQKIGERMNAICEGTKGEMHDQVTLHTGQTSDLKRVGLSWISGLCKPRWRCSAVRSSNNNFRTEQHEFGHSMGLNHDGKMPECVNEKDGSKGFMGGKRDHFRKCYKTVLERSLSAKRRDCIFSNSYPSYVKQFN